ncbi:hypothetical protein Q0N71_20140 [Bacillus thuringiensis]|uniref:nucleoside 2-deoxyribosyltransferase n=1 Tax=Bacillus thuringiensis TaxID=1428 RepID=UPI00345A4631
MSIFLESFIPAIAVSGMVVVLLYTFMLINQRKKHEIEKQLIKLETMREYYESQLYNINSKMISNPERWKDVNHLVTNPSISESEDYFKQKNVQYSEFLKSVGLSPNELGIVKDTVFVLTPFHEEMKGTYNMIHDICNRVGLKSYKSDELVQAREIFPQIIKMIVNSRVIIANLDGRNPNVFYELGIAHALGKPTIMISKSISKVPFDLQSKTIILYKDYEELQEKLTIALTKLIINN